MQRKKGRRRLKESEKGIKCGEQSIRKFLVGREDRKIQTPKRKIREEDISEEEQNGSKRKKTRHAQEDPHKLTLLKEARIVTGFLGKFEDGRKEKKGRNATGRKEVLGRKDSAGKRKEVLQTSSFHFNKAPGIENTSCTRRLNFNSNFKEKSQIIEEKSQIFEAKCPKLGLSDVVGQNKGDFDSYKCNFARTEEERQKARK